MPTEAALTTKIKVMLEKRGAYANVNHGSPFQRKGRPDIEACWNGLFIAFEVKLPGRRGTVTALQAETLREIVQAGGYAAVVTSVVQADEKLNEWKPRSHYGR